MSVWFPSEEENKWREPIDSQIFGDCVGLPDDVFVFLSLLIDRYPVATFWFLNKKLNEKGLMSHITAGKPSNHD